MLIWENEGSMQEKSVNMFWLTNMVWDLQIYSLCHKHLLQSIAQMCLQKVVRNFELSYKYFFDFKTFSFADESVATIKFEFQVMINPQKSFYMKTSMW